MSKKKVLFVATMHSHIIHFHLPYLDYWNSRGYEVHVAANLDTKTYQSTMDQYSYVVWHDIDFARNPFDKQTIMSYQQLKKIMVNHKFELMHTHTPIASIVSRYAANKCKIPKVVYTAHGFHFHETAPKLNWLLYYPIEKYMARYTDALITMNEQDYQLAKTKFKTRQADGIYKVNGVGIDLSDYTVSNQIDYEFKASLDIPKDNFVITIIGELNQNKNQIQMIQAIEQLNDPNITLLLVGSGDNYELFKDQYQDSVNIKILGYRTDIQALLNITNAVASMSYREGLPKNLMEAMVAGKPVIATNIRGNQDLVVDGETGYLVGVGGVESTINAIKKLKKESEKFGRNAKKRIKTYRIEKVIEQIGEIYEH